MSHIIPMLQIDISDEANTNDEFNPKIYEKQPRYK